MDLIPRPASVTPGTGVFRLDDDTSLSAPPPLQQVGAWLQGCLRAGTGLPVPDGAEGRIRLGLIDELPAETFRLEVTPASVRVLGGDSAGVFYGAQTLLQLLPPAVYRRSPITVTEWNVPAVVIADAPRFRWRGALLDVARHFMPVRDVLRFVDQMAAHRLNRLHLHLTDDQGWRVAITRYPRLTSVGGWRTATQLGSGPHAGSDHRPHGGFYSQDDIREIVAYAGLRGITVVPEIEMPGHVRAALAAYPSLAVGEQTGPIEVWARWGIDDQVLNAEETTVRFFCDVLDEIVELFPSPYICIGGDEVPRTRWRQDSRSVARARELGLHGVDDIPAWFIGRIGAHLATHGRRILGWDDLLEGQLPAGAAVLSWRGMSGAAAAVRRGLDVISCPDNHAYLDYRQSFSPDEPIPQSIVLDIERVYAFDPVPASFTPEQARHVLGGQANIWTEHMDSSRVVDYFVFPRLTAMAEVLWTDRSLHDYADFCRRLPGHLRRLQHMGIEYRPAGGPAPWQRRPNVPGKPRTDQERLEHIAALTANIR